MVPWRLEKNFGKAPSLLKEYPNCVRLATKVFDVPVQIIKANIAVMTLAPNPTVSPIITPIGESLLSWLPYVAVPIVKRLNAKNNNPMTTALITVPLTISFFGLSCNGN